MIVRFILVSLVILFAGGCDQLAMPGFKKKPDPSVNQQQRRVVQSADLAKLILKPAKKTLVLNNDPFKPLFVSSSTKKKGSMDDDSQAVYVPSLGKVRFLGVSVVEGEYLALIVSDKAKGAYRVDDYIKDFKVKTIKTNQVVLSNGSQLLTLRRGGEN